MFGSRKIRRRDRSHSTRRRRLGVEAMEGRLMLSATGLDLPLPALDVTQFTFSPVRISLTGAHVARATRPTDGGFINADASFNVLRMNDWAISGSRGATVGLSGISTNDQLFTNGAFQGWQNDYSLLGGGQLQPAEIVPWNDGGGLETTMQPVVVGPSPSMPGMSDGGSIPIHAIFADFRKDSHLASRVKAISSPVYETSVDSRLKSTTDNAIAGEWARAMVFEIAGGEPTASESESLGRQRNKTPDGVETFRQSKPLSSVETPEQSESLASQHAAVPDGSTDGAPGQPRAPLPFAQIGAIVAAMNPFDVSPYAADDMPTLGGAFGTEIPNITASVAAAVFDQLGEGNAAVIESSASGKSWLRSIGTSPLLMILALERIAALNSRRASREPRVAAARKPLRSRS